MMGQRSPFRFFRLHDVSPTPPGNCFQIAFLSAVPHIAECRDCMVLQHTKYEVHCPVWYLQAGRRWKLRLALRFVRQRMGGTIMCGHVAWSLHSLSRSSDGISLRFFLCCRVAHRHISHAVVRCAHSLCCWFSSVDSSSFVVKDMVQLSRSSISFRMIGRSNYRRGHGFVLGRCSRSGVSISLALNLIGRSHQTSSFFFWSVILL